MTDFPIARDADVKPAMDKAQPGDALVFAAGTYAGVHYYGKRFAAPGVTWRAGLNTGLRSAAA